MKLAIITRFLGEKNSAAARCRCGLPKWRLQRVIDYTDTNLEAAIGLEDLAAAAGLSRMHFAAQFRVSTGMRPHDFLRRRRIHRSQTLLAESNEPIVQIALSVGFRSQAHYTTVFKSVVGTTPYCWRKSKLKARTGAAKPLPIEGGRHSPRTQPNDCRD